MLPPLPSNPPYWFPGQTRLRNLSGVDGGPLCNARWVNSPGLLWELGSLAQTCSLADLGAAGLSWKGAEWHRLYSLIAGAHKYTRGEQHYWLFPLGFFTSTKFLSNSCTTWLKLHELTRKLRTWTSICFRWRSTSTQVTDLQWVALFCTCLLTEFLFTAPSQPLRHICVNYWVWQMVRQAANVSFISTQGIKDRTYATVRPGFSFLSGLLWESQGESIKERLGGGGRWVGTTRRNQALQLP